MNRFSTLSLPHRVFLSSLVLAPVVLSVAFVHAEDFSQRFYLNGGVGVTRLEPETSSEALTISDKSDSGGHLAVGFDISRFLTVEAYAATLGSAEVEFLGASAGSVDYTVFGVSALGYLFNSRSGLVLGDGDTTGLFRREGASVYGRVGVGHMQTDATRVNNTRDYPNHVAFGIGVEYGFDNGFALRTEMMGMDTDANYLNIGILKRFGSAGALPALAVLEPLSTKQVLSAPVPAPKIRTQDVFMPVQAPYIYFASDESALTAESTDKLDAFAEQVMGSNLKLQIEGHTDWFASESYNMSLSIRRAEAVANYLESKGISRERLVTMGYGESRPISSNDTRDGRALNRRTEIQLR